MCCAFQLFGLQQNCTLPLTAGDGCSDARHMAHDVDMVLHKIVSKHGSMDEASAQDYLKRLRSRSRYSCDVWS